MIKTILILLLSFFLIFLLIKFFKSPNLKIKYLFILFIIGTFASEHYLQNKTDSDPPQIVVDEVVGQWLTLTIVPPDLLYYMTAFFLFRVADILKPWPANKVDSKMKNGFGVMLDDVVAAIYAASVLFVIKVIIVG